MKTFLLRLINNDDILVSSLVQEALDQSEGDFISGVNLKKKSIKYVVISFDYNVMKSINCVCSSCRLGLSLSFFIEDGEKHGKNKLCST